MSGWVEAFVDSGGRKSTVDPEIGSESNTPGALGRLFGEHSAPFGLELEDVEGQI